MDIALAPARGKETGTGRKSRCLNKINGGCYQEISDSRFPLLLACLLALL